MSEHGSRPENGDGKEVLTAQSLSSASSSAAPLMQKQESEPVEIPGNPVVINPTVPRDMTKKRKGLSAAFSFTVSSRLEKRECLTTPSGNHLPDSRRAWTVALGGFFAGTAVMGLLYSTGIFIVPLLEEFGTSLSETSLISSIQMAFFYIAGLFAAQFAEHFGFRVVATFGGILWTVGWILASFSQELWHYILCLGVLSGTGGSLVYWPIIAIMPQWFKKYRATAMGITILGSGVGNIALSFGGQQAILNIGWRNTLRIIGCIGSCLVLVAVLLVERRVPVPKKHKGVFGAFKAIYYSVKEVLRFTNARLFLASVFFFQFTFFVPYTFMAPYVNSLHLSQSFGGLALSLLGVGSATGRIIFGPIADYVGRIPIYRVTFFLTALVISCWPACTTESALIAFSIFYGFCSGGFVSMFAVISSELWGIERLSGIFTMVNIVAIPGAFASGPVFGAIVQAQNGSYNAAIATAAVSLWVAWILVLFMSTKPAPPLVASPTNAAGKTTQPSSHPHPEEQKGDAESGGVKLVSPASPSGVHDIDMEKQEPKESFQFAKSVDPEAQDPEAKASGPTEDLVKE